MEPTYRLEEELVDRLATEVDETSKMAVARQYGFSASYIDRVLKEQAPVSWRLARAMGSRREVWFAPLEACAEVSED